MSPIVIERDGHIALVRINRPEKRNALNPERSVASPTRGPSSRPTMTYVR